MPRHLSLWILLLIPTAAFGAKLPKGESATYLCIGQGVDAKGRVSNSAEGRFRVTLPSGMEFDKLKEPVKARGTLISWSLHDVRGKLDRFPKAVSLQGNFEMGKTPPKVGPYFHGLIPKGEKIREVEVNLGNTVRHPSVVKVKKGKRLVEHLMLCQWE